MFLTQHIPRTLPTSSIDHAYLLQMSSPFRSLSELRALGNLINTSIDQIEQACQSQGKDLPSLNEPSSAESEAILLLPDVMKASNVIVAAAAQLTAAVRPPTISLFAHAHLVSTILDKYSRC